MSKSTPSSHTDMPSIYTLETRADIAALKEYFEGPGRLFIKAQALEEGEGGLEISQSVWKGRGEL